MTLAGKFRVVLLIVATSMAASMVASGVASAERLPAPSAPAVGQPAEADRLPVGHASAPIVLPARMPAGSVPPEWVRFYPTPERLPSAPPETPIPDPVFGATPPNLTTCTTMNPATNGYIFVVEKRVNGFTESCTPDTYSSDRVYITKTFVSIDAVSPSVYRYSFNWPENVSAGRVTSADHLGQFSLAENSRTCVQTFDQTVSSLERDRTGSFSAIDLSFVADCGDGTVYFGRLRWARPSLLQDTGSCVSGGTVAFARIRQRTTFPFEYCETEDQVGSARIDGSRLIIRYLPGHFTFSRKVESLVFEFPAGTAPSTGTRWITPSSAVAMQMEDEGFGSRPAWGKFDISHLVVDRWGYVTELDASYLTTGFGSATASFTGSLRLRPRTASPDSPCMTWTPPDPSDSYFVVDASYNAYAAEGQCLQSAILRSATYDGKVLNIDMLESFSYGFIYLIAGFPGTTGVFIDDEYEQINDVPADRTLIRIAIGNECLAPTGTLTVTRFELGADQKIKALDATLEQRCLDRPPLFAKVHINQPNV